MAERTQAILKLRGQLAQYRGEPFSGDTVPILNQDANAGGVLALMTRFNMHRRQGDYLVREPSALRPEVNHAVPPDDLVQGGPVLLPSDSMVHLSDEITLGVSQAVK